MNRELFVKKRKVYKQDPKPFEWEHGSYNAGEIINGSWVYYDYYGKDVDNEKIIDTKKTTQTFKWAYTDDKYNNYTKSYSNTKTHKDNREQCIYLTKV